MYSKQVPQYNPYNPYDLPQSYPGYDFSNDLGDLFFPPKPRQHRQHHVRHHHAHPHVHQQHESHHESHHEPKIPPSRDSYNNFSEFMIPFLEHTLQLKNKKAIQENNRIWDHLSPKEVLFWDNLWQQRNHKKNLRSFMLFSKAIHQYIKNLLPPDTPVTEIQKVVGQLWNTLPENLKWYWTRQYRGD